jgi:hypothetical protein
VRTSLRNVPRLLIVLVALYLLVIADWRIASTTALVVAVWTAAALVLAVSVRGLPGALRRVVAAVLVLRLVWVAAIGVYLAWGQVKLGSEMAATCSPFAGRSEWVVLALTRAAAWELVGIVAEVTAMTFLVWIALFHGSVNVRPPAEPG